MHQFERFPQLVSIFFVLRAVSSVEVEFMAEYYSNVTLVCDDRLLNLPQYTTFKKYWILPNGTALLWSYQQDNSSRFSVGQFPDFNLTISNVDEDDFGWYYCVVLWDNYIYLVHTIKIGLNVHGALFKELLDQYRKSAIIGLIAGAVTATLIGLICLLHWCRYSETNTENDEKLEKSNIPDTNEDTSDINSQADTVYAKEKEAIYELDKAVDCYDDDATVAGDGEVAIGLKANSADSGYLEEDGLPLKLSELAPATVEITQPEEQSSFNDDGDCNISIPPPPPPPPLLCPLNSSFEEAEDSLHGYLNRVFDLENDEYNKDTDSETERNYLYQRNSCTTSPEKEHYADVKF